MCGILGIINVSNREPVSAGLLSRMVETMRHRGPDDRGTWIQPDGQCGLAHRRLSIMDLSSAGHQPMPSADGNALVTFNGEIYNYPRLRREFESAGSTFKSRTDTEIILHLYQKYGADFISRLDGDFGIGLWDVREKRLILARDRAGVKPIYYTYFDGRFMFASEIKALLEYPGISKDIDPVAFYHYLSYLVTPPPATLIHGIRKLEAGSFLILNSADGGDHKVRKYWEPFPKIDGSQPYERLDEELESLYSASVHKRLMSDVPVGVLFSGGVDSTLNAAAFQSLISPERVKTFTVGMDDSGDFHDDSVAAREMAAHLGTEHHEVRINDGDLLDAIQKLAMLQDEPVSDPVSVPLYFVTKFAKENGVTVLHAGEGADELFCGYRNYQRFLRHERRYWRYLSQLPKSISQIGSDVFGLSSLPKARKIRDVFARCAKRQELFMSSAVAYYELEKKGILSEEFSHTLRNVDSFDVVRPFYERLHEKSPDASLLQKITFIELQLRLPELLLMRADKMSMANSVEIRVPFLDRDLMDFAVKAPDDYKLRQGIAKEPIKRLAAMYAPRDAIYRRKTGFGVPIKEWFRGRLGSSLDEALVQESGEVTHLLDVPELRARIRQGPRTVNEAFQLWMIYNVLAWHRAL